MKGSIIYLRIQRIYHLSDSQCKYNGKKDKRGSVIDSLVRFSQRRVWNAMMKCAVSVPGHRTVIPSCFDPAISFHVKFKYIIARYSRKKETRERYEQLETVENEWWIWMGKESEKLIAMLLVIYYFTNKLIILSIYI